MRGGLSMAVAAAVAVGLMPLRIHAASPTAPVTTPAMAADTELQGRDAELAEQENQLRARISTLNAARSELERARLGKLQRQLSAVVGERRALAAQRASTHVPSAVGSPANALRTASQLEEAEASLRHKARLVAARIRQVRGDQRLASDVMRMARENALFDEEERRLDVSKVVQRTALTAGNAKTAGSGGQSPGTNEDTTAENDTTNGPAAPATGTFDGTPPPGDHGGGSNTQDPSINNLSGRSDGSGMGSTGTGSGSVAVTSQLIAGSRTSALIDKDVDTLLSAAGGSELSQGELLKLEQLRIELLRNADELARQRGVLESQARPRR